MPSDDFRPSGIAAAARAGWLWALVAFVVIGAFGVVLVLGGFSRSAGEIRVVAPSWTSGLSLSATIDQAIALRGNLQPQVFEIAITSAHATEATVAFIAPTPEAAQTIYDEVSAIVAELKARSQTDLDENRVRLQERLDRSRAIFKSLLDRLSAPQAGGSVVDVGAGLLGFEERISELERELQQVQLNRNDWIVSSSSPAHLNKAVLLVGVLAAALGAALLAILLRGAFVRRRPNRREITVGET
jgi:hypothetical protein